MKISQRIKESVQIKEAQNNSGGYLVNKETYNKILEDMPLKNLTKITNYKVKTGKTILEIMTDYNEGKII